MPCLTLLAFGRLLLIALTPLDLLLLLALAALHLLLLNALAALDLLRPFTLRALNGTPLYARLATFHPGLAPLHAGSRSLRLCPRSLASGTSAATTSATPAPITLLRLGQAGSAGTKQQYTGCCRYQRPVHLDCTPCHSVG